jgi:hypothetical protein
MITIGNDQKVKVYLVPRDEKGNPIEEVEGAVEWSSSEPEVASVHPVDKPPAPDPGNQRSQSVKRHEKQYGAYVLSGQKLGTTLITAKLKADGQECEAQIQVEVVAGAARRLSIEADQPENAIETQPSATPPPGGPVHREEELQRPEPRKEEMVAKN